MDKSNSVKKVQENKKKKNNNDNRSKVQNKQINNNNSRQKKIKKTKSEGEKPVKKTTTKSSNCLWFVFIPILVIFTAIGFLYLVDEKKFLKVTNAANASLNKTLSILPPEVVTIGKKAVDYTRPIAEVLISKIAFALGKLSTFLNTNEIVRDHWVNIREICATSGRLFVDYLRTVYSQSNQFCSKLYSLWSSPVK